MMKTFLFLAGLLMQMALKVLLLFPYDEAAIVQQRSWLGTYESYRVALGTFHIFLVKRIFCLKP